MDRHLPWRQAPLVASFHQYTHSGISQTKHTYQVYSSCVVIPQDCANIKVIANNIGGATDNLAWWIRRNPSDDSVKDGGPGIGARPILTVSDDDPVECTLDVTTGSPWGSFNIILFDDPNRRTLHFYEPRWFHSNGKTTKVRPLCYLNLVIVNVELEKSDITYTNTFTAEDDGTNVTFYSGGKEPSDLHAMDCKAQIHARGGGDNSRLGCSKIRIGWLQNG